MPTIPEEHRRFIAAFDIQRMVEILDAIQDVGEIIGRVLLWTCRTAWGGNKHNGL